MANANVQRPGVRQSLPISLFIEARIRARAIGVNRGSVIQLDDACEVFSTRPSVGTPFRRRIKAPVESKSAAKRWGEAKERALLLSPPPRKQKPARGAPAAGAPKEVPTLEELWPTFIDRYCKAERQKPSTVATTEWAFKKYIGPILGPKRLDAIGPSDIQDLKAALSDKSPKSSNNVLTVLSACLKFASAEGLKGHEGSRHHRRATSGAHAACAPARDGLLRDPRVPAPAVGRTGHRRADGARDPSGRGCRATPRGDPRPSLSCTPATARQTRRPFSTGSRTGRAKLLERIVETPPSPTLN